MGACALGLLAAAPPPGAAQPPAPTPNAYQQGLDGLRQELLALFEETRLGRDKRLGAYVLDADTGQVLIEVNGGELFAPASLLKIFTAGAALDTLGPDHRFKTSIEAVGAIEGKTLQGALLVRGGGDPALGPRFQRNPDNTTQVFRDWAHVLKDAGIRKIDGSVVGDDTLFLDDRVSPGWPRRELAEWYCAEVSALSFNDNTIDVLFRAPKKQNERATATISPRTEYATFVNSVRTGAPGGYDSGVRFYRNPTGSEVVARGRLEPGERKTEYAAMADPAMYAATVLKETLEDEGITVAGRPARVLDREESAILREQSVVLFEHTSEPVSALMPVVLAVSQNLYAEVLARHVALAYGEPADFQGAGNSLRRWAQEAGIPAGNLLFADGSGLSRASRLTPRAIGEALLRMRSSPHWELFRDSLAYPGGRGSLRTRFTDLERRDLAPRLHAKTGYIDGAHGLAGYLTTRNGGEYVFVIVANNVYAPPEAGRRFVEEALLLLDRSPALP
ncbi:MAG: D-alanyl-D-alanine carboxypeptidase/D-alanyl-D-alanine-endopeptidase [Candidatus Sumerlaeia bacterium]|nr:D-alanyl-D-alanine carboxypeptidase/D-alanyl-D-alanine-endopeptidase [Candidatus Sumerlaeia bacterium]